MLAIVSSVWTMSKAQNENRLPSLCDQWNVLYETYSEDLFFTYVYSLSTDTTINGKIYTQLVQEYESSAYYKGAMREGNNRDIYYVPVNSTHEYLLYAFNAQVGDTLTNLWVGGWEHNNGDTAIVGSISDDTPRVFTLDVIERENDYFYTWNMQWIEGIGSIQEPLGYLCPPPFMCAFFHVSLLCAYKNGEQVYASELSEQYGCEYNYDPFDSGLSNQSPETRCTKLLREGQLLILRGNKTYTIQGQEVK